MTTVPIVTVSQLNQYMSKLIQAQSILQKLRVEGELANVKQYRSGHLYFSLRDQTATISCVMFAGAVRALDFQPKDGDQVVLDCKAGFYERDGRFQLNCQQMTLAGLGNLFEQFEAIKRRLDAEGLLDPSRKKSIPRFPKTIGVVTSPSGAVIRDILNVLKRRWPGFHLILAPSAVQGEGSVDSLINGLEKLESLNRCDVIIIGRGGGSIEDLWSFNDERLARRICTAKVPIISAVGHETDFTICDFVADLRAPTPSAAAELAVSVKADWIQQLQECRRQLARRAQQCLSSHQKHYDQLSRSPALSKPQWLITARQERLFQMRDLLEKTFRLRIEQDRRQWYRQSVKLEAMGPMNTLLRGYAMMVDDTGAPKTSIQQIQVNASYQLYLKDGTVNIRTESIASDLPEYLAEIQQKDIGEER